MRIFELIDILGGKTKRLFEWMGDQRIGSLAVVASVLGLGFIVCNVLIDILIISHMTNFGVDKPKRYYVEQGESTSDAVNTFDNQQLRSLFGFTLGRGQDLAPDRFKLDVLNRKGLLNELLEEFGLLIDGPFHEEESTAWKVDLYLYPRGGDHLGRVAEDLREQEYPYRIQPTFPALRVELRSEGGIGKRSAVRYRTVLLQSAETGLSATPWRTVFERAGGLLLPVRPVTVNLEPSEIGALLVEDYAATGDVVAWMSTTPAGGLSGVTENLDKKDGARLARLLERAVTMCMSDWDSAFRTDELGSVALEVDGRSELGTNSLSSRVRLCRLLNGVNLVGFVNLFIIAIACWGGWGMYHAKTGELRRAEERAREIITLLPMLGFFGTLYGMLMAFASQAGSGSSAKLISFIGVSLDTTILAVTGSILLLGVLMFRLHKEETAGT